MNKFWRKFQHYLFKNKVPDFLVGILEKCGYDTAISIKLINEKAIEQLQQYIDKNFRDLAIFKKTPYENKFQEKDYIFTFLPGHISLLLGLSNYIDQFLLNSTRVDKNKRNQDIVVSIEEAVFENNELSTNLSSELLTQDCKDKLKILLLTKVLKFTKKKSISSEDLTEENILDNFEVTSNRYKQKVYKCSFKCHSCSLCIPCIYNKSWLIGNLQRHLKTHNLENSHGARSINQTSKPQLEKILDS